MALGPGAFSARLPGENNLKRMGERLARHRAFCRELVCEPTASRPLQHPVQVPRHRGRRALVVFPQTEHDDSW